MPFLCDFMREEHHTPATKPHLRSASRPSKPIRALSELGQNLAWACHFDLGRREVEFAYVLTGRNFSNIVTS